ncbi:NAD(P)/FAD-dependent oxidoreductase [Paraburkholderia fungorum]|jgi:D-amino-acid dehydrogenase|uniref:NAD(P)/FAD-dependent oxidoreductase n=2 Tax=Pseudomonadota TaxID=1224 RepID=UPI003877E638
MERHLDGRGYDVIVIGAGIIGLTTAYELLKRGRRVAVVDALDPMQGCSAGNAGYLADANIFPPASRETLKRLPKMLFDKDGPLVISPAYLPALVPWGVRLARSFRAPNERLIRRHLASLTTRAIDSYSALLRDIGAQDMIERKGGLVACLHEATLESRSRMLEVFAEHGVEAKRLNRDEVLELEPALTPKISGGIFYPNSARCVNPQRLGLVLARHLVANGVQLVKGRVTEMRWDAISPVSNVRTWKVQLTDAFLSGRQIVVCAGRAADSLMKPLGHPVSLASERGYHLMLTEPKVTLNRPVVFAEPFFAATPMEHGLRLAGTAEFAHADKPMTNRRADMLFDLAKPYLPGVERGRATRWMGIRPTTPDGLPVMGASATHAGLFYSFGHGHIGLTTAAVSASCVAAAMANETPLVDLQPFSVDRFS